MHAWMALQSIDPFGKHKAVGTGQISAQFIALLPIASGR